MDIYHIQKTCLNCKKSFFIILSKHKKGFGKFCSLSCRRKYKGYGILLNCVYCGKKFKTTQCFIRRGKKYCSEECQRKGRMKRAIQKCLFCYKDFMILLSQIGGSKKFCSKQCFDEFQKGKTIPIDVLEKREKTQRALWKNEEFKKKSLLRMFRGLSTRPTSLEKQMITIIKKYNLPYKYVGDGEFWIGMKNPDFISTDESKNIIEVGNNYHKKLSFGSAHRYECDRVNYFSNYGWKTHIFLTDGKLNEEEILRKIG